MKSKASCLSRPGPRGPAPYSELSSQRAQPLYTALLRLEGRAGQEVCLRITPLDSSATNPTPATACARVPE